VLKTALFYPLELSRTRITADMAAAGQPRHYSTIRQCISTTFAQVRQQSQVFDEGLVLQRNTAEYLWPLINLLSYV
jgi:hypothetical protein